MLSPILPSAFTYSFLRCSWSCEWNVSTQCDVTMRWTLNGLAGAADRSDHSSAQTRLRERKGRKLRLRCVCCFVLGSETSASYFGWSLLFPIIWHRVFKMSGGRCCVRCFKANGCFKSSVLENLSVTAAFVLHICLSVMVLFLVFSSIFY